MKSLNKLQQNFSCRGPLIHVVLDGWGVGAPDETNAIYQAALPVTDRLMQNFPYTQLWTHGKYVGLPSQNDLGGSEVGHMTMGAGVIKQQGPTLIKKLIQTGDFYKIPVLTKMIKNCLNFDTPLHLLGLLSDGNIHSHLDHMQAIVCHAFESGIRRCYVHALLDGRDVGVQSALIYTEKVEKLFSELKKQRSEIDYAFASGGGREAITMDRDNNWEKVEAGWNIHVKGKSENSFTSISDAIEYFRNKNPGIIDQDIPGFVLVRNGKAIAPIEDNHGLLFTNFRGDRAIEFSKVILEDDFPYFDRFTRPKIMFAGMTQYDQDDEIPTDYLVGTPEVEHPFGKRILELGIKQFRLSESQKYPHVTFFYNGGYREPIDSSLENYYLIESDKIPSFASKPGMKAREISNKAVEFILSGEYQYGLINFANADMVGHTGDFQAAVNAVETIDAALDSIVRAIDNVKGLLVITADHGNADQMLINNSKGDIEISTKHSLNPVPFMIFDPLYDGDYHLKPFGENLNNNLSNVAATNFILLGQSVPDDLAPPLFA